MNYQEIISWARDKLEQEKRQNQFDIDTNIFPIRPINTQNDAVRELVLECCDNTARTPLCEINVLNNEDMLLLEKKYENLKSENKALIKLLKVAYHNPNKFSEVVYRKMSEMSVKDVSLCDFVECAKTLGR